MVTRAITLSNDLVLMLQALGARLVGATQDPGWSLTTRPCARRCSGMPICRHESSTVCHRLAELLTQASTALIEREAMIDDGRAAVERLRGYANLTGTPSARR
jgi:hypothetical protein